MGYKYMPAPREITDVLEDFLRTIYRPGDFLPARGGEVKISWRQKPHCYRITVDVLERDTLAALEDWAADPRPEREAAGKPTNDSGVLASEGRLDRDSDGSTGPDTPGEAASPDPEVIRTRLVYCTYCHKTHSVLTTETPCAPGAWLDPDPVTP